MPHDAPEQIQAVPLADTHAKGGLERLRARIGSSPSVVLTVTVVTLASASLIYLFASIASLFVGVVLVEGNAVLEEQSDSVNVALLSRNRRFFAFTLIIPQLSLLLAPIPAALLFPGGVRKALGLVATHWPWWVMVAGAVAAPFVGMISSAICSLFVVESESLRQTAEIMRFHSATGFMLPLVLLISVTPSICEEVLFRGFLQNRLVSLMPPWFAIVAASTVFALFHIDPVHVVAVFPLGVWLGWLTYASRSLLPAMLAHCCNNAMSVWLTVRTEDSMLALPEMWLSALLFVIGFLGLLIAIGYSALVRHDGGHNMRPSNRA